jgi:hypothetical protein
MNLLSRLRILGKLCHGFPDDSLGCGAQHRGLDDWNCRRENVRSPPYRKVQADPMFISR